MTDPDHPPPPQSPPPPPPQPAPPTPPAYTVPVPNVPPPPAPPYPQYPYGQYPQGSPAPAYGIGTGTTNGLAVASMVLGIVGLALYWMFALCSIVAVVLGHIAMAQTKRTGHSGRGMAIAGIATGYTGIGFFLVVLIAVAVGG